MSYANNLVEEGLTYFEKSGDAGDKEYVKAIRQHIAHLSTHAHQAVYTGTINGVHVGLHGTRESIEAIEAHLSAQAKVQVTDDDVDKAITAFTRENGLTHSPMRAALESFAARLSQGAQGEAVAWRYRIGGRENHLNPWVYQTAGEELVERRPIVEAQPLYTRPAERAAVPDDVAEKCRMVIKHGLKNKTFKGAMYSHALTALHMLNAAPQPPEEARAVPGVRERNGDA